MKNFSLSNLHILSITCLFTSSPFTSLFFSKPVFWLHFYVKVKVKVAQSCPTLRNPMDYTVHGILQARTCAWLGVVPGRHQEGGGPWGA